MKKIAAVLLCAVLMLSLAGCGGSKDASPAPTAIPAATAAPTPTQAPSAEPFAAEPEATAGPAENTDEVAEKIELVRSLIGKPVAELYDAIGKPATEGDYASSCLVTGGKDGMLYYDGFTVYTLVQPDGSETVYDVE